LQLDNLGDGAAFQRQVDLLDIADFENAG